MILESTQCSKSRSIFLLSLSSASRSVCRPSLVKDRLPPRLAAARLRQNLRPRPAPTRAVPSKRQSFARPVQRTGSRAPAKPSTIGEMIKVIEGDLSISAQAPPRLEVGESGPTLLRPLAPRELRCQQIPAVSSGETRCAPASRRPLVIASDPRSSDACGPERRLVCLEGSGPDPWKWRRISQLAYWASLEGSTAAGVEGSTSRDPL